MHASALTVPATLDSLAEIAAFVLAAADAAGLDRQARYRLRLSVDELVSNIIMHGHGYTAEGGSSQASIDVRTVMNDKVLTVILEDTSPPFDPRQVPAPDDLHLPAEQRKIGGLGVYLALDGVDRFSYERVGNLNRSTLVVNRSAPSASKKASGSAGG
jgi:anti-sigma regulatory factor (Ser/Thr protein kinase)